MHLQMLSKSVPKTIYPWVTYNEYSRVTDGSQRTDQQDYPNLLIHFIFFSYIFFTYYKYVKQMVVVT